MTARKDRLRKLGILQEKMKALHEIRHAGFLAQATAAEQEARALIERFDAPESISGLFPDIYHRRIESASARGQQNAEAAREEAVRVATATARAGVAERSWQEALRQDERRRGELEILELIERALPNRPK